MSEVYMSAIAQFGRVQHLVSQDEGSNPSGWHSEFFVSNKYGVDKNRPQPDFIIRAVSRPGELGMCYLNDWKDENGTFWGRWYIVWEDGRYYVFP
jgi:hypothetical protein